ncbi:MAG: hypothetical protein K8T25_06200 [Planctomycetia bacterium]|nr:hypothetical protein [Planctomycetia bacterium]
MNNRIQPFEFRAGDSASGGSSPTAASSNVLKPGAALLERNDVEGGCSLFTPLHYEPNYAYPLIVWLHGTGENENVLQRVMTQVSLRNQVAVAPRGTVLLSPRRMGAAVRRDSNAGRKYGWQQDDEHIYLAQMRVTAAIEQAETQLNVHQRRIFLAGSGSGGTMALRIALCHPRRFAGALSLDGGLPRGGAPLLRLRDARRLPLFIGSGRTSGEYPSADVCDDLRLLYAAGMSVTLKEYPGSNMCRPQVLSDVNRWVMEILAEQQAASVVLSEPSGQ